MRSFLAMMLAALMFVSVFVPLQAHAETNILVIVDGSNSMWGQIENKAKVETARETLGKLVSDLPSEANLGLMAYGHTRESDCNDVELLSALGKDTPKMITTLIHTIQPTGKTPIATALSQSKDAFKGREGQNNHVLLVSDGIESCDGDPCAVAKELQEAGLNVSAHVIGFGVSKEEGKQLTCIAENTGGKYFDVADTAAFNEAVEEVTQLAQAEPEPEPEPELWFEDNFDGDGLADHWEIINPEPDAFIVENGVLTVVASSEVLIGSAGDLPNIFRLTKSMPKGDWIATMRFKTELSTLREIYGMGLYTDKKNMLMGTMGNRNTCCKNELVLSLWGEKVSKGQKTDFALEILRSPAIGGFPASIQKYVDWVHNNERAIELRIEKTGRAYVISTRVEGDLTMENNTESEWKTLQKLTSLRQPGDSLILAFNQQADAYHPSYNIKGGESVINVEWVKIEALGGGE